VPLIAAAYLRAPVAKTALYMKQIYSYSTASPEWSRALTKPEKSSTGGTVTSTLGWGAVLLSILVLLVFSAIRFVEMAQVPAPTDSFAVRYVEHPVVALVHIVPGLVFIVLAPLQFIPRIRQRQLRFHRRLGWLLVPCAAVSGLYALVAAYRLPAFGGFLTQAATSVFGALFLFSLAKAVYHIRRREVRPHREWMIRVFALALGVATIRLVVGLSLALTDAGFEEVFGVAFWLGLGINLLVAEAWIRHTRRRGRSP
jgi:uncharacterized membrane protein